MRVLVLESSTTSAKAMLYDSKVGVVRVCAQTYDPRYNHDGMQDAAYVMKETFRMGREAAQVAVDYITVGGVWHSVVCATKTAARDPGLLLVLYRRRGLYPAAAPGPGLYPGLLPPQRLCAPRDLYPLQAALFAAGGGA